MTAPTTAAGQTFDTEWPGSHIDRLGWQKRILAIEVEASAAGADAERDRVRDALHLLRPLPNDRMGSGTRVDYFEGWHDAILAAIAILDAPAEEP